jgi:hypothetical protein
VTESQFSFNKRIGKREKIEGICKRVEIIKEDKNITNFNDRQLKNQISEIAVVFLLI